MSERYCVTCKHFRPFTGESKEANALNDFSKCAMGPVSDVTGKPQEVFASHNRTWGICKSIGLFYDELPAKGDDANGR